MHALISVHSDLYIIVGYSSVFSINSVLWEGEGGCKPAEFHTENFITVHMQTKAKWHCIVTSRFTIVII